MKYLIGLVGGGLLLAVAVSLRATPADTGGPSYATEETRRVVQRMVEAHGGLDRWRNAPTISYDNVFFNPFAGAGENPWWYSWEVIEQAEPRRTFQRWSADEATLAYDGQETWSTNWKRGNPPAFQTHFFYYFVNLPWLTQDPGVDLGPVERASLPGQETEFLAVDMTFSDHPSRVKSGLDTYRLFIHPDTGLLQAYQYTTAYGAMLDLMRVPDGQTFGPMYRWHDAFQTVDGLTFPSRMHTMPPDASETWGYHLITNFRTDLPFEDDWLNRPENAVTDHSSRDR